MGTTFRAAYFVAADGQSDVLLTTEDQAHLSEADLRASAEKLAVEQGIDLDSGDLHVGDYTTQW